MVTTFIVDESDLSAVGSQVQLVNLTMKSNHAFYKGTHEVMLQGFQPLKSLEGLEFLDLAGNYSASLLGLEAMKSLTHLNVSGNLIRSLKPIGCLINLVVLEASNNKIREIRSIENLRSLTTLELSNNLITTI